jgi:hypothetical protein
MSTTSTDPTDTTEQEGWAHTLPVVANVSRCHYNHRRFYPPAEMWELGNSIVDKGVTTECIGRPHPDGDFGHYELAAGHRRRLGACIALAIKGGLTWDEFKGFTVEMLEQLVEDFGDVAVLPMKIRELSDAEMLAHQGIENFQRVNPNAIEVADYFHTLMQPRPTGLGLTLDQAIASVRKDRGFVVKHLKLLTLAQEVKDASQRGAFGDGDDSEYLFILARIPTHAAQVSALGGILGTGDREPHLLSLADARKLVKQHFTLQLVQGKTPFDMENPQLVKGRGPCASCPDRAGSEPSLFPDLAGATCTNVACYADKSRATFEAEAIRDKAKVMTDKDVSKNFSQWGDTTWESKYVTLDQDAPRQLASKTKKTLRDVLKERLPALPIVRAFVGGQRRDLILKVDRDKAIEPLLKAVQTDDRQKNKRPQAELDRERERKEKDAADTEIRRRACVAIFQNWPKKLTFEQLQVIAKMEAGRLYNDASLHVGLALGMERPKKKMDGLGEEIVARMKTLTTVHELESFIAAARLAPTMMASHYKDDERIELTKVFSEACDVDVGAITREVKAEANAKKKGKPKTEVAAAPAKKPAKATKKPAKVDPKAVPCPKCAVAAGVGCTGKRAGDVHPERAKVAKKQTAMPAVVEASKPVKAGPLVFVQQFAGGTHIAHTPRRRTPTAAVCGAKMTKPVDAPKSARVCASCKRTRDGLVNGETLGLTVS